MVQILEEILDRLYNVSTLDGLWTILINNLSHRGKLWEFSSVDDYCVLIQLLCEVEERS